MIIKYKDGYITGYEKNFNNVIVGYRKENSVDITDKPKGVKGIKADAFINCDLLTDFVIPEGITEIGEQAFRGCANLESVTLPDGLKVMKKVLFYNCFKLKKVDIPESVVEIENLVFSSSTIESIEIPDSVKKIGTEVFSGCRHLANVKLPNQLQTISASMFRNCENLETIDIPDTVKKIDEYAFYWCLNLKEVKLPENLKMIDPLAFSYCEQLEQIHLPSKLVTIGRYVFNGCTSLQYIKIPETVKIIGESAFAKCSNLVVEIPDNFQGITNGAFYGCKEIQFKSFNVFRKLKNGDKLIGLYTIIKNYFQDKTLYTKEELDECKEFVVKHKKAIISNDINNFELLRFIFEELDDVFTITEIRDLAVEYGGSHAGVAAYFLNYLHNKLESVGTTETDYTLNNELTLEDYTPEEIEQMKNNKKDDEDEMKPGL